jgi:hypothetical protein
MTAPVIEAKKVIESLPKDSSFDEIIQEIAFLKMVQKGLSDSKKNKTISNKDFKNIIDKW